MVNIQSHLLVHILLFFSHFGNLIASGKVDISVCKNYIEKARNVSFCIYKFTNLK